MNLARRRVFQKPTLIAQITLMAQRGSDRLEEFPLRDLRHQRDLRRLLEEPPCLAPRQGRSRFLDSLRSLGMTDSPSARSE
jgi:hypothetical protein